MVKVMLVSRWCVEVQVGQQGLECFGGLEENA